MQRLLFILLEILAVNVGAKTTYIPIYSSNIQIVFGKDTIQKQNELQFLDLISQDKSVRISIIHEQVDKEKVKSIKRAKRASGWAKTAAVLSGISVSLNPGRTPSDAVNYVNQIQDFHNFIDLSRYTSEFAEKEQNLDIDFIVENLSEEEINISDMGRGLTWYLRPHEYLKLEAYNPDACELRIANIGVNNMAIKYVTLAAGNTISKEEVSYENDDVWITPIYLHNMEDVRETIGYVCIDKKTFEREDMSIDEFKSFKNKNK